MQHNTVTQGFKKNRVWNEEDSNKVNYIPLVGSKKTEQFLCPPEGVETILKKYVFHARGTHVHNKKMHRWQMISFEGGCLGT